MANKTAYDIVKHAYRLIGMNSPDETLTGSELANGLYYLNEILDSFQSSNLLIPYYGEETFDLVGTQDTYIFSATNPNAVGTRRIVDLGYVSITINKVIYPIKIISQSELYDNIRYETNYTLPRYVILKNEAVDSKIIFYPIPNETYSCTVRAKFALENLEPHAIIITLPPYYERFLRYAVGRELASEFKDSNVKWSAKEEDEYNTLYKRTIGANNINLQLNLTNTLFKYHLTSRYVY